jgi:hypothetical protein
MKFAIQLKTTQLPGGVKGFTDHPYFLRPKYLPSGRATPETASVWKVEDEIESSKGSGLRQPVAEKSKSRKREGRRRFKAAWKGLDTLEEISYLTVDCDFQAVPASLSRKIRARSEDRGFYFVTEQRDPILGPKTQDEVEAKLK